MPAHDFAGKPVGGVNVIVGGGDNVFSWIWRYCETVAPEQAAIAPAAAAVSLEQPQRTKQIWIDFSASGVQ